MKTKNDLHRAHLYLSRMIPEGTELQISTYDNPVSRTTWTNKLEPCEPVYTGTSYHITIYFPLKARTEIKRPDNVFGITYKANRIDLPEESFERIVNTIVAEEQTRRRFINARLRSIRRGQWLFDGNVRVDGAPSNREIAHKAQGWN